jgi:PhoPQ-activated pathogenicity-related protein
MKDKETRRQGDKETGRQGDKSRRVLRRWTATKNRQLLLVSLSPCLLVFFFLTGQARADLAEYVKKPEPKFSWKLRDKSTTPLGALYDVELVSQEWHGILWKHTLQVYQAPDTLPADTMLVWNTGGTPKVETIAFGMSMSARVRAPIAILYGIPNQPLFGGKTEDTLIAETFVRYLDTKDDSWPLLFPMAKSVVKAMDALQALSKQEWKKDLKHFVISGASKRGWTTWLTGVVDPRVKGIAPCVIDTLSMVEQMEHQKKSFGTYSEQIGDYTERGLVPMPDTPEARKLWKMVDPLFYRDQLRMPKLIINGNNDPYWTVDALNLYWDKLEGEKYIVYVPNAGHNLEQTGLPRGQERSRALDALGAFTRYQMTDKPMPKLDWKHDDIDGKLRLTVTAKPAPLKARLWVARSATRDFRKSPWIEQGVTVEKDRLTGLVDRPAKGFLAFYGDLEYEVDGIRYTLSTQIRVAEAP